MLVCAFYHFIAHETAGAARIRLSLRPLIGEGVTLMANLGRIAPRDRGRISRTGASEGASPLISSIAVFPLNTKTHYGAAGSRYANSNNSINIKGLATALSLWRAV